MWPNYQIVSQLKLPSLILEIQYFHLSNNLYHKRLISIGCEHAGRKKTFIYILFMILIRDWRNGYIDGTVADIQSLMVDASVD